MDATPSIAGDGPGADAAPADVTLLEPLPVLVIDGKPYCPTCHENLEGDGSIKEEVTQYNGISVEGGKIAMQYGMCEDGHSGEFDCAACGQRLDSRGWDF